MIHLNQSLSTVCHPFRNLKNVTILNLITLFNGKTAKKIMAVTLAAVIG